MKVFKIASVFACALALCVALAGCGGGSAAGSSAAASGSASASSASAAASTVEEDMAAIQNDFRTILAAGVSHDAVKAGLLASDENGEMVALLEQAGLPVDEYVDLVLDLVIFEPKDVKVDGDAATLAVDVTMPDWENSDATLDAALEAKLANVDRESMSEAELLTLLGDVMRETLVYPIMPSTTTQIEVGYKKVDGQWQIADNAEFESTMDSLTAGI